MADNDNAYLDAYGSIVNYVQRIREDLIEKEISPNIEFKDIDGHAEDAVLQNTDYIFLKDFSSHLETHFRYWVFMIGVSTFEDAGMFRHRQIMNYIVNRFYPLTTIPLYDAEKLTKKKGILVVEDPIDLWPFSKYNTRAVQYLLVNVSSTETTRERQLPDHI